MNGYELHANTYRETLKQQGDSLPQEVKASVEREIKILDIMAKLDEKERRMIFDTGAYNDIVKTYCKKAMEMHEMSEEDIQAVLGNIGYLFDTIRATEL